MSTTVPLVVTDPIKGGANIAIRVDPHTSSLLQADMSRHDWASRSQYTSMILQRYLEAYRSGAITVNEVRVLGRRRGRNAPEHLAMWQAHDPEVVRQIKVHEHDVSLPRHMIGRAAIVWHLTHPQEVQS